jgi:hypothetical protein
LTCVNQVWRNSVKVDRYSGKLFMAKTTKLDGMLRSLLAAMLAIFVVLSPASGAMSTQCNTQHIAAHHDASVMDTQHPIKHEHGTPIGQDDCCKSSCVACIALLVPSAFGMPICMHDRTSAGLSILLVGMSPPPLLGPPRTITSTL